MKITYLFLCVAFSFVFTVLASDVCAAPFTGATAAISKVEGDGIAKVRRKSGVESVAGVKQELFPGDRITTDARSVVEIILADGSLVRVGLNTEYRLESVNSKGGIFRWVFSLTKGSIRALVEKNPNKNMVKFRVNTPVGTMGVRGTELVLAHNPRTKRTTLHTIEGRVEFGLRDCHLRRDCIEVKAGESSHLGTDSASKKPEVKSAGVLSLLLIEEMERGVATAEERLARAALFSDLKKSEFLVGNLGTSISPEQKRGMEKLIQEASAAMAAAQDTLLDRTKEQRNRAHRDIANGTYQEKLKLAEKFDDLTAGSKQRTAKERTKENLSAIAVQKKLNLADAVLRSREMKKALARAGATQDDVQEKIAEAQRGFNKVMEVKQASAEAAAEAARRAEEAKLAQLAAETESTGINGGEGNTTEEMKQAYQILDKPLADAILSEETVVLARESYTYEDEDCFLSLCSTETKTRTEATHTVTSKIERSSGICFETKRECQRKMIPCDLKSGKSCRPTFTEFNCENKKVQVTCPANGTGG